MAKKAKKKTPKKVEKNLLAGRLLENLLVTTDDWFASPTGQEYKHIYGDAYLKRVEDVIGFAPPQSTNWVLDFGDMIIFGCRIHYIAVCKDGLKNVPPDTRIYKAQMIDTIL